MEFCAIQILGVEPKLSNAATWECAERLRERKRERKKKQMMGCTSSAVFPASRLEKLLQMSCAGTGAGKQRPPAVVALYAVGSWPTGREP